MKVHQIAIPDIVIQTAKCDIWVMQVRRDFGISHAEFPHYTFRHDTEMKACIWEFTDVKPNPASGLVLKKGKGE